MQRPQPPHSTTSRDDGFWSPPRTIAGWCAVVIGVLASAFCASIPLIHNALNKRYCPTNGALCLDGRKYVAFGLAIGLVASAAGFYALVAKRDRTVLVALVVATTLLVTLFWLFFAAGEIIAPH